MSFATQRRDEGSDLRLLVVGSAPYLSDWKQFKDYIRQVVEDQPGWVKVHETGSQNKHERRVSCDLKGKRDAEAVFSG